MDHAHQYFSSQNHQGAGSKDRFIGPSPGDSDPGGWGFCTKFNQVNNQSVVHNFPGEVSTKGKSYRHVTLGRPHWCTHLGPSFLSLIVPALICGVQFSIVSHSLSDGNHHIKGERRSSWKELGRNLVISSDPGSTGTRIRNTSKDFPRCHNHVIVKKWTAAGPQNQMQQDHGKPSPLWGGGTQKAHLTCGENKEHMFHQPEVLSGAEKIKKNI